MKSNSRSFDYLSDLQGKKIIIMSPNHLQRRVQSMNNLSSCTTDGRDAFDVREVIEACRIRRKELETFKEIHRRRSEKLHTLLSGCSHLVGNADKLRSQSTPNRRHSVPDFTAIPTATWDRSCESLQSSNCIPPAVFKQHGELANTNPDDCPMPRILTEPIKSKQGLEYIRRGIEQRRQKRLQRLRSIGVSELGNIDNLSDGNIIEENIDEEDDEALYI